ncbi:aminopeptidase N [Bactrocera dorsalis]|uniref:Aminopeptidase n=1 Tax=Bactrocera dorsalis TaxID=27457 RepID=A0A6I9VR97_BACDO|nr:aminopeptidase N [Bactrocera dorsalis]
MIRSKLKVNVVLLATLAIIVSGLTATEATIGLLPPEIPAESSSRFAEPDAGIVLNPRADINYRLPNNTEPIHYDIELTTNVHNGTRNFTGKVQILFNVVEDTRTIVVHARELEDFQASIRNGSGIEYALVPTYELEREFLSLTPQLATVSLNKGTNWTLTISYKGELHTAYSGFHIIPYTDAENKVHYMATTQFESTNARHAFPCYDEPAKRATFTITIRHDASYNAISNMPKNETASSTGVTVFDKTNVTIPTYLIAFHISDYAYTEGSLFGLPHRLYSKPSELGNHQFGLVSGMLVLQGLADYYNVSFVMPRLAQVAIPSKGGAMENWGLVTYGEAYLLYNKTTGTTASQFSIANIIAHELTHQWFGNHVAVRWWTYLWLKEGFATLYSYEVLDEVFPEWDVYQRMHVADYQSALIYDGQGTVVPLTHYAQTPAEISARYGTSSYAKPSSVLFMWQHALGDKVFRSALNKYLTKNAISSAEEWDLFDALQSAVDEQQVSIPATIRVMFPTWSQQSGYPLLTVTRNYNTNTFTVTQTFYNDNKTLTSDKTFYVPFNYVSRSKFDFRDTTASHYLLNVKEINITDTAVGADDWLILNKQSTGYYRINYDTRNWQLIADGLAERPTIVHPRNRAQLLYDAYRFVTYDRLEHAILLRLLAYLPGEDQYAPWYIASSIITNYYGYLNGHADYEQFKLFIQSLVSNAYELLQVNDVPGEQFLRKYTRNLIVNLACTFDLENCLVDSNNKLKTVINGGSPIEPNTRSQAYCNGLRSASDTDFDYFYNDLLKTSDATYSSLLLSGLGCSQSTTQLEKFVKSSIDTSNSLTSAQRTTILSAVYSHGSTGLLVSIDFLSNNWEAYASLSTNTGATNPLSRDIVSMSNYVNNRDQEAKLLALVTKVKSSNKVAANLEDTVTANMKVNFDWLDKNSAQVLSFVKTYRNSSATFSASLLSVFMVLVVALARFW